MDGNKVLGGVRPGVDDDGIDLPRMYLKVVGAVVHLAVDNDPNFLLGVVLLDLLHSVYEAGDALLGGSGNGGLVLHLPLYLEESTESGGIRLAGNRGHPSSSLLPGLGGVLKSEHVFAVGGAVHVKLT